MMMTCRLLCALLVLALCCCSSACAADVHKVQDPSQSTTATTTTQDAKDKKNTKPDSDILVTSDLSTSSGLGQQASTSSDPPGPGPVSEQGAGAGTGQIFTVPDQQSNDASNSLQKDVMNGDKGAQIRMNISMDQTDREAEVPAKRITTTTSTRAPTTSTTTTAAPEAPTTTPMATEAPTTTTTRAPSRPREIDGSLSSSAWVCAPLLLAVSALAYTTVG
ncbi:mucin TcMUCII, putative [Trypanosoma cruzi marinkellei]|uniref:Mucin TcMUCII, putative n=1 Tax=Trypanosoma cruzi marinkellei TaxID=85056 RepID=K2NL83_TRYCR|nr:mucin TcMUCII, putative [Trypanosoma cruzi marinkellei]